MMCDDGLLRFRNLHELRRVQRVIVGSRDVIASFVLHLTFRCSADRDVFAFDWLGMGASARPSFEATDENAAEAFFLEVGYNAVP
jgi:hypothetical protein